MDVVGKVGRKMQKQACKPGERGGPSASVDIRTVFCLESYPLAYIRNPRHPSCDKRIIPLSKNPALIQHFLTLYTGLPRCLDANGLSWELVTLLGA